MASRKINYVDKISTIPGTSHINQVWDDDMNEIKDVVNEHADTIDELSNNKANLDSPVLVGNPQAPTKATDDNSSSLATTAFVKEVIALNPGPMGPSGPEGPEGPIGPQGLVGNGDTYRWEQYFTSTEGQTLFNTFNPLEAGYFDIFNNGIRLDSSEFSSTVNSISLLSPAVGGDVISVIGYTSLSLAETLANSGLTSLGTITIVDDEVTFENFAWRIESVDYAQVGPITRTLPFAAEGMYRTHVAYMTITNDIDIVVGPEDSEVTTEPDIPPGTLRLRAFNVFGEIITTGPGESVPFDLLTLDEFTGDTDGWMWIKVLGYDFKIKRSNLGGGGISDAPNDAFGYIRKALGWTKSTLAEALNGGKTATFTGAEGTQIDVSIGEYSEDNFNSPISFRQSRTFDNIEQISTIYQELGVVQLSTYFYNLLTDIGKYGQITMVNGEVVIHKQNQYPTKIATQRIGLEDIAEVDIPIDNIVAVFKPKPKFVSGTYYLVDEDYVNELLEGLKTKQPVRVATTDSIFLNDVQLIDGVILVENDRILVKDQSDAELNGIYIVKEAADWMRSTDANTATELTNAVVSVLEGTANGQSTFRQITTSIVLGTSNIVWTTFGTSVPDATDSTKGKAKLAATFGSNTDTAIRQDFFTSTINKIENYFISKQNGTFGSHTGDLLETVLSTDDVVGGFFIPGDGMAIRIKGKKSGTIANITYRIRFGTTGTTADALIATYTGNNQGVNFERLNIAFLTGDLVNVVSPTANLITDTIGTNSVFPDVSLTYSAAWKITITGQLGNAGETASIQTLKASKTKSI